jgi:hypothetical protein
LAARHPSILVKRVGKSRRRKKFGQTKKTYSLMKQEQHYRTATRAESGSIPQGHDDDNPNAPARSSASSRKEAVLTSPTTIGPDESTTHDELRDSNGDTLEWWWETVGRRWCDCRDANGLCCPGDHVRGCTCEHEWVRDALKWNRSLALGPLEEAGSESNPIETGAPQ